MSSMGVSYSKIEECMGVIPTRLVDKALQRNLELWHYRDLKSSRGLVCKRQFEVKDAGIMGAGLFARINIRREAPVGEYLGKYVMQSLILQGEPEVGDGYLADTGVKNKTGTHTWCIDAAEMGNETRFINTTSEPEKVNCKMWLSKDRRRARVYIYTTRRIKAGEQLFMDYGKNYKIN